MPRQARLDSPGTLHHVIIRGIEKKRIVYDSYDRANFVTRMGDLADETGTSVYAWSLMTTTLLEERRPEGDNVIGLLDDKILVDYSTMLKYEGKMMRSPHNLSNFY